MNITTVGLDIAKQFFQVHGVDPTGQVVLRKRLRRNQVSAFLRTYRSAPWGWKLAADRTIGYGC